MGDVWTCLLSPKATTCTKRQIARLSPIATHSYSARTFLKLSYLWKPPGANPSKAPLFQKFRIVAALHVWRRGFGLVSAGWNDYMRCENMLDSRHDAWSRVGMIRIEDWYGTSSTAQGGGGSFKKRKTIGEIGCCESRMSEQKHWPTD